MRILLFIAVTIALGVHARLNGIDVSGYQPNVNWATVKANGVSFAYIKATEGTSKFTSYILLVQC